MRNLKRALSLAMAVVMLLGMMVIGAGAVSYNDFTDKGDIENKEAVSLMVDLGIIKGTSDTTYSPKDGLERAALAKLVYFVLEGEEDASLYEGANVGLNDVAGTWAEGYINYCVSQGLINGNGDGTFTPAEKLTVAAAAKTLLVALGYDAIDREYVGAQWSINVISDAKKKGLLAGIDKKGTAEITRDEAARMFFNALNAKTVTAETGRDMGEKYVVKYNDDDTTLGEQTFGLYRNTGVLTGIGNKGQAVVDNKTITLTATPEQVGSNVAWYTKGKDGKLISTSLFEAESTILATITKGVTYANITTKGAKGFVAEADETVSFFKNGVYGIGSDTEAKAGVIVEVVDNNGNGKVDVIRVTEKTVKKATADAKVTAAKKSSDEDTVTIAGTGITNQPVSKVHGYEDVKKGDYILFVKVADTYYIDIAESVEGQITSKRGSAYNMNGVAYTKSGLVDTDPFEGVVYNTDVALYLDDNGTVIAFETIGETEAPTEYTIVLDSRWVSGTASSAWDDAGAGHGEVSVVGIDGVQQYKTVKKIDKKDATASGKNVAGINLGNFYEYSENSDGSIDLFTVADQTTFSEQNIERGKVNFITGNTTIRGNAATKFIIRTDDTANKKTTYSVVTGIANAPVFSKTNKASGTIITEKGFATLVYVNNGQNVDKVESKDTVYFLDTVYTLIPKNGNTPAYRVYSAIVKGEEVEVNTADENLISAAGLYSVVYTDGIVTSAELDKDAKTGEGVVAEANGVVGLGGNYYTYTADTTVAVIDDGEVTFGGVELLADGEKNTVVFTLDKNGALADVYVTIVPEE